MQIDFHHSVTYVAARLAKFSSADANLISYSAQYVDEAINSGIVYFRNKAMYSRISSAHKMVDYRNFEELANHHVWIPFHFLPGNGGEKAGDNPEGSFVNKLICHPNSHVALDMVKSCIDCCEMEYGLHRLGITMHVLADTFAHQGFAGINDKINKIDDIECLGEEPRSLMEKIANYFGDLFDSAARRFVEEVLPLGHGAALTSPDMPFLKWKYKNGLGKEIVRNNTEIFIDAVKSIHHAMVCYRIKNPNYSLTEDDQIPEEDLNKIRANFLAFDDEEGEDRHEKWLASISEGDFSFWEEGEVIQPFIPKGIGSWKFEALDTKREVETKNEKFRFNPEFLNSDWKLFHDALQIHRMEVIRNILPKYGICAA
ncbi:MAG: hypothetical protein P9L92_12705 [Candidatus Electryonea clarkiae]|nr:hypothetical protein [Candidatus Electryonea clarkiae]